LRSINKPAPKNTQPPEPQGPAPPPGNWEKPTYCPRRASPHFSDQEGRFIYHRWDAIVDYGELDLLRMCFPEEWVINVPIPMTNRSSARRWISKNFILLGLHLLHVAYHNRVPDRGHVVVVHQAHQHVWGCAFLVECLQVKESL
jgi:hypothetical protein